jgi:hypothetical protein
VKIISIIVFLYIFPSKSICQSFWSPSIIIGSGITKIDLSESNSQFNYFDYSYPMGYLIGFENKINIIKKFYLSNSLYFKNERAKSYFTPGAAVLSPFLKYSSYYLRLSSLLGIETLKEIDILFGIDIGKKNNITIKMYDHNGKYSERLKLSELPKYDASLCIGLRKNLKIKKQKYHIDLKYLYGLTEYKLGSKEVGYIPNPTKNMSLQFEFGSKF